MMYDAHGNQVLGRLNTDRPHYFKLQPTYDFKWGTSVGATWYIRSGALYSKSLSYQGYAPTFFEGRGSLGRTPVEQALDVLVQHDIKLPGHMRLNVNLNVANLLDNDVATSIWDTPFRNAFTQSRSRRSSTASTRSPLRRRTRQFGRMRGISAVRRPRAPSKTTRTRIRWTASSWAAARCASA